MPSTFRADTRVGLKALADAFKDDTDGLVQTYRNRPEDFAATPCLYVGGISEPRIVHTSGVRQRDLQVSTVLVDELSDNEETADRLDILADAWIDYLTANPRSISGDTLQTPVRSESVELSIGGVMYAAVEVTVLCQIQEGRV
jgi:hypothetical protein